MPSAAELQAEYHAAFERYCKGNSTHKIHIRFKALGRAPILKQQVYKITASETFSAIPAFLRRQLALSRDEEVYVYLHSFTPAADEKLSNLHNCFKTDGQLVFSYSLTPAFG